MPAGRRRPPRRGVHSRRRMDHPIIARGAPAHHARDEARDSDTLVHNVWRPGRIQKKWISTIIHHSCCATTSSSLEARRDPSPDRVVPAGSDLRTPAARPTDIATDPEPGRAAPRPAAQVPGPVWPRTVAGGGKSGSRIHAGRALLALHACIVPNGSKLRPCREFSHLLQLPTESADKIELYVK